MRCPNVDTPHKGDGSLYKQESEFKKPQIPSTLYRELPGDVMFTVHPALFYSFQNEVVKVSSTEDLSSTV